MARATAISMLSSAAIDAAISQHSGNVTLAAMALGVGRSTLYKHLATTKGAAPVDTQMALQLASTPEPAPAPAPMATARVNIRIKEVKAPAHQVDPSIELMRGVEAKREERASRKEREPVHSPLGDAGPYMGEIFGTHGTRAPRVGAPVSRQHIRVLAIGDTHFHPGLPQTLRCMALIGHHAAATRPEHIVHIGDGSDWNSVCRHTKNDTYKARQKPSIRQDLDNFSENWDALNAPMDAAGVTSSRHYTMGNHDAWLETFEDLTPEVKGMATGERDRTLARAGWSWTAYGEFYFLGGVGFVHVPLNLMGKPAGGATPENSIATQATHDIVFGHTHRFNACRRVKMGYANQVTVVNTGGAMPEFYVGDYAQNTQGAAMTSGVLDIDIFDGRIQSQRLVTMRELEKRYGHLVP